MKVGIVVPFSWSFWGGVPEHADHQARTLLELGHEAKILMGHDPPGRLTKALHPRVGRHERPPDYVIPVGRSVIVPANGSLSNIVLTPRSMRRMSRAFEEEQFDVLHVHEPFAPIISAYALAVARCPIVTTSHSSGETLRWYPVASRVWGVLAERIDHRLAVSERAAEAAERYLPGGPVEVLPNGVMIPPEAHPDERERHVVFIGRNEPRKGLAVLLAAWPTVAQRTGSRLRVVGADPLSVRWLMRRHGFSDRNVDLLGSISEEALTEELLSAAVLAAPSIGRESFGMVLTRAFGCATPVVASDIEGYRDVATPETSVLVPPGDSRALADGLIGVLEDEQRRVALGLAGRKLAESEYGWERIVSRMVEIYSGLVGVPVADRAAA